METDSLTCTVAGFRVRPAAVAAALDHETSEAMLTEDELSAIDVGYDPRKIRAAAEAVKKPGWRARKRARLDALRAMVAEMEKNRAT